MIQDNYETFFEAVPVGLIIVDSYGNVVLHNALGLHYLGIKVEDLLERSFCDSICIPAVFEALSKVLSGETHLTNCQFTRAGMRILCRINAAPADESNSGAVIALEDISPFFEIMRIKQTFISTLLDRLKGPLAAVKTGLSALKRRSGADIQGQDEIIALCSKEVDWLNALMKDLHYLYMITSGLLEKNLAMQNFPVREAIQSAMEGLARTPAFKSIASRTIISGAVDRAVRADFDILKQVVSAILQNACIYSPEHTDIRVEISDCPPNTCITITDKGIGIRQETLSRIFDKFFREDNTINRFVQGSGLGLYIAKSCTEAMGGSIYCSSVEGNGAAFVIAIAGEKESSNGAV